MGQTLSLVAALVLFYFSSAAYIPSAKEKPIVMVQKAQAQKISENLIYPARIESKLYSSITAEAEGLVKRILRPLGSQVRRGEVVLIIENRDPVYTYASVVVRAPAAGVISQMSTALMSKVSRGDKLFTITDPRSLRITAEVPAANVNDLKIGNQGTYRSQYSDKESLKVQITGLSPLVDSKTGTATAEIEFLDKTNLPAVGSLGQVSFSLDGQNMFLIPETALTYKDGKPYIRVISAGKMQKKAVELGLQKNEFFEIKSGINEGEQVVLRSNRFVKEGEEVEIEKAKQ